MTVNVEGAHRSIWRMAAWLAAVVTWLIVPVWAWLQLREVDAAQAGVRFKCGMPLLAIVLLATLIMAVTSMAGLVFAFVAWQKGPRPHRWTSNLELALFCFSACVCVAFAIFLWSDW